MPGSSYKPLRRDKALCKTAGNHFINRSSGSKSETTKTSKPSTSNGKPSTSNSKPNVNRSYTDQRRNAVSEQSTDERYGLKVVLKKHITDKKIKQLT